MLLTDKGLFTNAYGSYIISNFNNYEQTNTSSRPPNNNQITVEKSRQDMLLKGAK
jgi:hypothetical protein